MSAWHAYFLRMRPDKCFISAWIACGYFDREHFPGTEEMSYEEACKNFDPTGMLKQLGIPNDHAGQTISADRRVRFLFV